MRSRSKLDFIYFDAGGGHRSAALALQAVIAAGDYPWEVRLVNLQEILDSLDIFRKLTGIRLQDIYNLVLAKGWTLGSNYLLPCMHGVIRIYHAAQVKLLTEYWRRTRPDMVVSLIPNFNRAIYQSLAGALPEVPFVTVLTDLADYPPHFWMEKQEQFLICGTEKAAEQAHQMGFRKEQIFRTSGMILRPEFYAPASTDKAHYLRALGLQEQLPTALVLFGAEGSNKMLKIAEDLGHSPLDLQAIMICGRNESIRKKINQLKTRNRIHAVGFTREIPHLMRLADFFVGKPGPGSISEALHMGLPVIVERNAWTLPQERYNAEWILQHRAGIVLKSFNEINDALRSLLSGDTLRDMQASIGRLSNRAVFEIPSILEQITARKIPV